ncbi:MAG: FAD-dependent oxidoreductase, partial [Candidatus Microthrix subdominans]
MADRPTSMTGARRRLVIVGGGISGLAAAWEASIGGTLDVTVLDDGGAAVVPPSSRPDIGGKLRTSPVGGVATDEAADMFLARVPEGLALADELGLSDRLTAPVAGGAAIWMDGAAHPMPTGLVLGVPTDPHALGGSGLLEADDIQAVRSELVRTGRPVVEDRSIGSLIRERLGDRIADRLVQPLLGGINAGVIDRLSLAAAAPQLDVAARSGPSLTGALAATRRAAGPPSTTPAFYGLPGGMTELVTTLRTALSTRGVRLRDAVRVESVERAGGELRMVVASTRTGARAAIAADAVILA